MNFKCWISSRSKSSCVLSGKDANLAKMENCTDFLNYLGPDLSITVLTYLDDPSDLLRMASVSGFWRQFVIVNGFCKKLCIRLFPEVLHFTSVMEERNLKEPIDVRSSTSMEWESLERDHRVYAHLARSAMSPTKGGCIHKAITASSTDNYPEESIEHTLEPKDEVKRRPSYWSSEGKDDPEVPETLTYMLKSKLCLVTEVNIQPFKAYFQYGHPIYSARAVRFRMGHAKSPLDMRSHTMVDSSEGQISSDGSYIWTYTSPEFPMKQESCLQTFKLPQPVICIGGILQIELLGRIQRQEMDGLYYICICHVQVIGKPLLAFDVDFLDFPENCILKYAPYAENHASYRGLSEDEGTVFSSWRALAAKIRQFRLHSLGF